MNNFNRFISLLLTISLLLGIIPSGLPTYATDNGNIGTVSEDKVIDTTTADYPILLKGRINTARLTKIGQYSKLTDEEKTAVCDYYKLTDVDFAACESLGYNIIDSVRIAKAAKAAEITPAEYEEYINAYGGEEEASFQLRGYNSYKSRLSDEYKAEFESLMKKGYEYFKLRSTYYIAKQLNTELEAIVPDSPEEISFSGEETGLAKLAAEHFCDPSKLQTTAEEKSINTAVLMAEPLVNAEATSMTETAELTGTYATSSETISDTVGDSSPAHSLRHDFIGAPSVYFAGGNENVSSSSGALSYRENLATLKGKNGLDLNLDLVFNGNANMYRGTYTEYEVDESFTVVKDWYNSITVRKEEIYASYGIGWSFDFPSISYTLEPEEIGAEHMVSVWRYHPQGGGAYEIIPDENDIHTLKLKEYPRDDISIERISSGGVRYRVTYANGRIESFDYDGRIMEISDRFGNKISFEYSGSGIDTIIDSLGREVEFVYQSNPSGNSDRLVNIFLPDSTMIQLGLYAEDNNSPYLLEWINGRPMRTEFTYVSEELRCSDEGYFGDIITNFDGYNEVLNISAITYNTGLTSRYLYETVPINNGVGGAKQVKRVTEHYQTETDEAVTDIAQMYNYTTYSYDGDYSGYYKRISVPEEDANLYTDPNELPEDFEYTVEKTQNGVTTRSVMNNKHRPKEVYTLLAAGEEDENTEETVISSEIITYDQYELPIKKETTVGEHIETTVLYENDNLGNVLKYWSAYADGEKNDEYLTAYTYDSAYNLPTSVSYKKNSGQTVSEVYTVSSDGKTVTEKEVRENGAVKERTQYTYDTYGNITRERKYITDTQYTDINYDYTDTTGITRPEDSNYNGAYLTKIWQNGGNDIDGNPIGSVEYKYEYDTNGRKVKETDPLGNTTAYTYDEYNRITKITNPENKTQLFSYRLSTTVNETTFTDEAGTQLKYVYDPANNLTDIIDITSGETLLSYDYDNRYRLSKERNVQLLTSGYETSYTYDIFDRLTAKETKNSDNTTVAKETYAYDDGETSAYRITTHTIVGDNTYAPSIVTKEYINAYGNLEKTGYVTGNNEYFTTYKYDYAGEKTEELAAIADQKDWTNTFTSKWEYDYAGRVLRQYDANNNFVSYEYDKLGRVIKAYDAVANTLETPYFASYVYDNLGNVIQETIPQTENSERKKKYKYDKLGRVTFEEELYDVHFGAEQYRRTRYTYDWRGNVIETAQGGYFSTTYAYDDLGRLINATTDGKTTAYTYNRFGDKLTETFGGKTDTYEYDMNGFNIRHIRRDGTRISYTPNALQQVEGIISSTESGGKSFEYALTGAVILTSDATGIGTVQNWYDDRGNMIKETNVGMEKTYTYDIAGKRESFAAKALSTTVQNLGYTYNTLGQLVSVNENDTPIVSYTYDANGNLLGEIKSAVTQMNTYNRDGSVASIVATNNINEEAKTSAYTYYNNGDVRTETMPDNTVKTYTYNSRNMLSRESLSTGKTVSYAYNASGNRASKTETENGQNTVTEYVYDGLNQLTREYTSLPDGNTKRTYYAYDDNGSLILRSRENTSSETATDSFSFGMTSPNVDTFKYNGFGEMISATVGGVTTSYTYYANGTRRTKTASGETTVHMWDGDNIIADTDGDYAIKSSYVRGVRLAEYRNGNETQQYSYNRHGDVTELIDKVTGSSSAYDYDAYGNQQTEIAGDENPFRYSGEYYDAETGFIYLRARYYDPTIGRFISEDPIRDGLNWYAYCNNNPIRYKDPSGLIITCDEMSSERIISLLREVSGNSLEFEYKDGQINITKTYDTDHHVGQTLVSDLINSKEEVNVNIGVDKGGRTNISWPAERNTPMQIFIDPDKTIRNEVFLTYTQDSYGNVLVEESPAYIEFGHELIHSWRDIRGIINTSETDVGLIPHDAPELWPVEELQTVGINYTDAAGNPLRTYDSYVGTISENGLRLENGLNVRISYYGVKKG